MKFHDSVAIAGWVEFVAQTKYPHRAEFAHGHGYAFSQIFKAMARELIRSQELEQSRAQALENVERAFEAAPKPKWRDLHDPVKNS